MQTVAWGSHDGFGFHLCSASLKLSEQQPSDESTGGLGLARGVKLVVPEQALSRSDGIPEQRLTVKEWQPSSPNSSKSGMGSIDRV